MKQPPKYRILYHNDNDGKGSAAIVKMKLEITYVGSMLSDTRYIPVQYGQPLPDDLDNAIVIIVDFSYKRDEMIRLSAMARQIILIDHHETAEEELKDIQDALHCPSNIMFDMLHAGAVLTWKHFFNDAEIPLLIRYIEDYDMWNFKMNYTHEVKRALELYPWQEWLSYDIEDLVKEGTAIEKYLNKKAKAYTYTEPRKWELTGDVVPVYNMPHFIANTALHMAAEKYPDSLYAVGYFDLPDKRIYQLRSIGDFNVSQLAEKFGGGGHKNAASFSVQFKI